MIFPFIKRLITVRVFIFLSICFLGLTLSPEMLAQAEDIGELGDEQYEEGMKTANKFVIFVIGAIVIGLLIVFYVLPRLGDKVSDMVYSDAGEIEKDAYAEALSKVAQGDYEGAVEDYKKFAQDNPNDRRPVVEIVKLLQDKLDRPDEVLSVYEEALEREGWLEEDRAYFLFRIVDFHLDHAQNVEEAKRVLQQITEEFPQTRHSANAMHKLRGLEKT